MAKKEDLDTGEFGFDDDLNMPDFDFDAPPPQDNRSPVTKVLSGVVSGAVSGVTDPGTIKTLAEKALPEGYGKIADLTGQLGGEGRKLYDKAVKDIKPSVNEFAKAAKNFIPGEKSKLKDLFGKLEEMTAAEKKAKSAEFTREDGLNLQIADIFKTQLEHTAKQQLEDNVDKKMEKGVERLRHKDNMTLQHAISNNISRLTQYNDTVNMAYQKKSLELQFRQYYALQDILEEAKRNNAEKKQLMEGIQKNTALPEPVKMQQSEYFSNISKNKFWEKAVDSVHNTTGKYISKMTKVVGTKVQNKVNSLKDILSNTAMGLDSVGGAREMARDTGASGEQLFGEAIGGAGIEKAAAWLGTWLHDNVISKNQKLMNVGKKAGYIADNFQESANSFANSSALELDDTEGNWIMRKLKSAVNSIVGGVKGTITESNERPNMTIERDSIKSLTEPMQYNRQTHKSINEIIPGYLARILRELQIARTNDVNTELVTYNPIKNKFTNESATKSDIFKSIMGDDGRVLSASELEAEIKKEEDKKGTALTREEKNKVVNDIKSKNGSAYITKESTELVAYIVKESGVSLNDVQRKALAAKLVKDSANGRLVTEENYIKANGFLSDQGTKPDAEKYAKMFRRFFMYKEDGKSLEDRTQIQESTRLDRKIYFTRVVKGFSSSFGDKRGDIQNAANLGYGDMLRDSNLMTDGNQVNMDQMADYKMGSGFDGSNIVTSDVRAKKNIKRVLPRKALHAIGKTPVSRWTYKDGRGDGGTHVGPMAQNVKANMGEEAAPGGVSLDLTTMNGMTMAAVQELTKIQTSLGNRFKALMSKIGSSDIVKNLPGQASALKGKAIDKSKQIKDELEKLGVEYTEETLEYLNNNSEVANRILNAKDKKKALQKELQAAKSKGMAFANDALNYLSGKSDLVKNSVSAIKSGKTWKEKLLGVKNVGGNFLKEKGFDKEGILEKANKAKEELIEKGKSLKDDIEKYAKEKNITAQSLNEALQGLREKVGGGDGNDGGGLAFSTAAGSGPIDPYWKNHQDLVETQVKLATYSLAELNKITQFLTVMSGGALNPDDKKSMLMLKRDLPNFGSVFKPIKDITNFAWRSIKATGTEVTRRFGTAWKFGGAQLDKISGMMGGPLKSLREGASKLGNGIKNGYNNFSVGGALGSVKNGAIALKNTIMEKGSGLIDKLRDKDRMYDIYVGDETEPRMLGELMKQGKYYKKFKKNRNHRTVFTIDDIDDTIYTYKDGKEVVVINKSELGNIRVKTRGGFKPLELVSKLGNRLKGLATSGFNLVNDLAGGLPAMLRRGVQIVKGIINKGLDLLDQPQDIYAGKDSKEPVLLGLIMRNGGYFSKAKAKPITRPSMIDGPIVNNDGQVVLTEEQIKMGLYDVKGNRIKSPLLKIKDFLIGSVTKAASFIKNKAVAAWNTAKDLTRTVVRGGMGLFKKGKDKIINAKSSKSDCCDAIKESTDANTAILNKIYTLLDKRIAKPVKAKKKANFIKGKSHTSGTLKALDGPKVDDTGENTIDRMARMAKEAAAGVAGLFGGGDDDDGPDIDIDLDGDDNNKKGRKNRKGKGSKAKRAARRAGKNKVKAPKGAWNKTKYFAKNGWNGANNLVKPGGIKNAWGGIKGLGKAGLNGVGSLAKGGLGLAKGAGSLLMKGGGALGKLGMAGVGGLGALASSGISGVGSLASKGVGAIGSMGSGALGALKGSAGKLGLAGAALDLGLELNNIWNGQYRETMPTGWDMISPAAWGSYTGNKIRNGLGGGTGGTFDNITDSALDVLTGKTGPISWGKSLGNKIMGREDEKKFDPTAPITKEELEKYRLEKAKKNGNKPLAIKPATIAAGGIAANAASGLGGNPTTPLNKEEVKTEEDKKKDNPLLITDGGYNGGVNGLNKTIANQPTMSVMGIVNDSKDEEKQLMDGSDNLPRKSNILGVKELLNSEVGISPLAKAAAANQDYYAPPTKSSYDDITLYRMAQYGALKDQNKSIGKLIRFEKMLKTNTIIKNNKATLTDEKFDFEAALALFEIDAKDEKKIDNWSNWFQNRFKPIYLTHHTALRGFKIESPDDVLTLREGGMDKYLTTVEFKSGPYDKLTSPFIDLSKLKADSDAVKEAFAAARKEAAKREAAQKEEDKKKSEDKKKDYDAMGNPVKADNKDEKKPEKKEEPKKPPTTTPAVAKTEMINNSKNPANLTLEEAHPDSEKDSANTAGAGGDSKGESAGKIPSLADGSLLEGDRGVDFMRLGNGVKLDGMHPDMLKNLKGMAEEYGNITGNKIQINSGFRSYEQQAALHQQDPKKAAAPGRSLHEFGLAVDINSADADKMDELGLMRKYGFTRPVGGEPWHVEPIGIQDAIEKSKRDSDIAAQGIEEGIMKGGGGLGTIDGAPKYKRDLDLIETIMNGSASALNNSGQVKQSSSSKPIGRDAIDTSTGETYNPQGNTGSVKPSNAISNNVGSSGSAGIGSADNENSKTSDFKRIKPIGRDRIDTSTGEPAQTPSSGGSESKPTYNGGAGGDKGGKGNVGEMKAIIEKAAKATGIDPNIMLAMAAIESGFNPNAKAGTSSASGLYQFLSGTWKEVMGKYSKKHGLSGSEPPTDPNASALMGGEYLNANLKLIKGVKPNPNATDAYLTHFLGPGGAKKFLSADKSAIAAEVLPKAAEANKSIFYNGNKARTIGEVYDLLAGRVKNKAAGFGLNVDTGGMGSDQAKGGDKGGSAGTGLAEGGDKGGSAKDPNTGQAKGGDKDGSASAPNTSMGGDSNSGVRRANPAGDKGGSAKTPLVRSDSSTVTNEGGSLAKPSSVSGGDGNSSTLNKQLDIQTQSLSVLKDILAKIGGVVKDDTSAQAKGGDKGGSASAPQGKQKAPMVQNPIDVSRKLA